MKMRIIFLVTIMLWVSISSSGFVTDYQNSKISDPWLSVDSLLNIGQPRSALEIVNQLYEAAKKRHDDPQFLKAVIYKIRIMADFREGFLNLAIRELRSEIRSSGEPATSILHSILAEMYQRYYQQNSWRFADRSRIADMRSDSIETWDLNTITEAIANEYMLSVVNENILKETPVERFRVILDTNGTGIMNIKGKRGSNMPDPVEIYPALYDFLAHRALMFFTSDQGPVNQPAIQFQFDNPVYFGPTNQFIQLAGTSPAIHPNSLSYDSIQMNQLAFRIFQKLAAFHKDDKNPAALINTELDRLQFVWENATISDKDSLYENSLKNLEFVHTMHPASTRITFALARFLYDQGQLYRPLVSASHKWDFKEAMEYCEAAVKKFPASDGAKNCLILANSIKEQNLRITMESAVLPGKPALVKTEFRNAHTLFFRIVRENPEEFVNLQSNSDRRQISRHLASLPPVTAWIQELPDDGDYQQHSAELPVPPVNNGFHILLCSTEKTFSDPVQVFAYTPFWASRISYVTKRNADGTADWFILDRETGFPLKNVKAEAWNVRYDYPSRKSVKEKSREFSTDDQGYFLFPVTGNNSRNNNYFLKLSLRDDMLFTDNFYQYPVSQHVERTYLQTMFYTDRAIYRPGQNIYFKGIILERNGEVSSIKTGHTTKVTFTDVNGQKVGEQSFTTNEFGSFNGSFAIPVGRLTGNMNLSNESGSVSVSVEEYKRPTFELVFKPVEGNYRLGEKITIPGKAVNFAGNPVGDATVAYRVMRSSRFPFRDRFWFWPVDPGPEVEISNGVVQTNDRGEFFFTFAAIPDLMINKASKPVFDFTIVADVTDLNGETQSLRQVVSVGYVSLLLDHNLDDLVNLLKDTLIKITTTNLNGRFTPAEVNLKIERLRQPDRAFKPRQWDRPDLEVMSRDEFRDKFPCDIYGKENDPATWDPEQVIFNGLLDTKKDTMARIVYAGKGSDVPGSLPTVVVSKPGSYLMTMESVDPFGEKVVKKHWFTAFDPASREVPSQTIDWFVPLKTSGEPGESARFIIGSKEDNVNVIWEVRFRDTLVSREWLKINNRAVILDVPIIEKHRGNFSVNFIFVKHNRVFQNSTLVAVPYSNKKLDVRFETFRSSLDPGAKESWKVRITGKNGVPVLAELLTAMYDASLDQFRPAEWSFNLYQRFNGLSPWDIDNAFRIASGYLESLQTRDESYLFIPEIRLNWFGFSYFGGFGRDRLYRKGKGGPEVMMAESKALTTGDEAPPTPLEQVVKDNRVMPDRADETALTPSPKTQPLQVRKNFSETAFFYPSLVTDSSGSLLINFTMPESLTKWRLLGLAHSKSLDYGLFEKELVTRKELMVFPNAPRFVRQGDTVVFSTKVVNLTDKDLTGTVKLELLNAFGRQPLDSIILSQDDGSVPGGSDSSSKFILRNSGSHDPVIKSRDHKTGKGPVASIIERQISLSGNQSTQVSWTLAIPVAAELSLLQYRVTAKAGNFSDGEEKVIPVLTNRMMVTESLPLPVRGKSTTEFTFNKLIASEKNNPGSLKNYRLTLEFASNPAWYAIQALPSLNQQTYSGADAIFNAFYSNSIASFIANSNPSVRAVFDSWKTLTPEALLSNLEKNESLKSALLEETPWVMEARNESTQKQKLGLYFDLNTLRSNLAENLSRLQKLQKPSGGWTWFEGMPESRWITQEIITGLGRLDHLGITDIRKNPDAWRMVRMGIQYLDDEITKEYINLKSMEKVNLADNHLSAAQVQYLYARSFFMTGGVPAGSDPLPQVGEAFAYYQKQAENYWMKSDRYPQGMVALALFRLGNPSVPQLIMKSLSEKSLHSDEMGMYWASANEGWYRWYQAPVETQAMMIEAFDEILQDEKSVEEMKIWLLKQKQTQLWQSNRATAEACYALLLRGTDLLNSVYNQDGGGMGIEIGLGKLKIDPAKLPDVQKEAGTGYFRMSWQGDAIKPSMGHVKVVKSTNGIAWGALYWQYFEDLDRITPAKTPFSLEKTLYLERNTATGPVLEEIQSSKFNKTDNQHKISDSSFKQSISQSVNQSIKIGDKLIVRIVLRVDRDLEFVHMKDMRASACEPAYTLTAVGRGSVDGGKFPYSPSGNPESLSGYRFQDGLGYYQSTSDLATSFFFDQLPKGVYVFEYPLRVNAAGDYSNGITTAQCLYAPEFTAHSEGIRIRVK